MLSKYTFLAPNLIRVSGEGADYAHLNYCSPTPQSFGLSMDLLNLHAKTTMEKRSQCIGNPH